MDHGGVETGYTVFSACAVEVWIKGGPSVCVCVCVCVAGWVYSLYTTLFTVVLSIFHCWNNVSPLEQQYHSPAACRTIQAGRSTSKDVSGP
jgi:hypothetical protein